MVDISLPLDEINYIISQYPEIVVKTEFDLKTPTQYKVEHIFYLEKLK